MDSSVKFGVFDGEREIKLVKIYWNGLEQIKSTTARSHNQSINKLKSSWNYRMRNTTRTTTTITTKDRPFHGNKLESSVRSYRMNT